MNQIKINNSIQNNMTTKSQNKMKKTTKSQILRIINLTPQGVTNTLTGDSYPPSGEIAWVTVIRREVSPGFFIPFSPVWGGIRGLPPSRKGILLLVSEMVLGHPDAQNRGDIIAPGEIVRGVDGQPTGCRGWTVTPEFGGGL